MARNYSRKNPKRKRKDGGATESRVVESIRVKEILGEAYDLIMNCNSAAQLKKALNSASWTIKKGILLEALELGHIDRANYLSTQILNLTESKKQEVRADFTFNERIEILMAEVTGVPFDVLEQRAREIRSAQERITSGQEPERLGTGTDRGRDEAPESFEVLVLEDGSVREQSLPIRNRNVGRRPNRSTKESS